MLTRSRCAVLVAMSTLSVLLTPAAARATCSVIPPVGFDQRGFLGSVTTPFLAPDLTTDIRVVGAVCGLDARSAAAGFMVDGAEVDADDLVVTIAYTPADASTTPPLLVLANDPGVCDGIANCTVDTTAQREMVQIPLPGGSFERRLRFQYPSNAPAVGPARLAVRLADSANPVASQLRTSSCQATPAGTDVACIGEFYTLDGTCRVGDAFVNQPFSGLVAIPRTDFIDVCTEGCGGLGVSGTTTDLPITTDRDGNVLFGLDYDELLIRVDRGDGQIEPRPRRLRLAVGDAVESGFADTTYDAKPTSFTPQGARLSPPFNAFVDPTAPPDTVGIWGMVDGESGVILLPRRRCSNDFERACSDDSDCSDAAVCTAPEFDFAQNGAPVELPIADALAQQGVELNSWLDGNLTDQAVALSEDETLSGDPLNRDDAADDVVVELLDRATGLIRSLAGMYEGRGLTQVRVDRGDEDYVVPSMSAESDKLAFIESEYAEGLASPIATTTTEEALAADVNGNGRLDQNLRVFSLPEDSAEPQATNLLPDGLEIAVLPDLRFDGRRNIAMSEGHVFFAYSEITQQPHAWQLANQSTDGTPGNAFSGDATLSADGRTVVFVSGADNLVPSAPAGPLQVTTEKSTQLTALRPVGRFPDIVDGRSVFEWEAENVGSGSLPSRFYLEAQRCDVGAGQPDLDALLNYELSGPNLTVRDERSVCGGVGERVYEFNRGIGKGASQRYRLVFDSPHVPASELQFKFIEKNRPDPGTISGPACEGALAGGVARVYLRDLETGTTQLVSVGDRTSCEEPSTGVNVPSENPDITSGGELVIFDSAAALSPDDLDASSDLYAYDPATCTVELLSGDFAEPARNASSSDDGSVLAFEVGSPPTIVVLDRETGITTHLGAGQSPDVSADGRRVVYVVDQGGVFQVELADLVAGTTEIVSLQGDGSPFPDGAAAPSVANTGDTAFEAPPGDPDSEVFVRNLASASARVASESGLGRDLCTTSPCGSFDPSISDDGRFVAFVVRGLLPIDEVMIKDLVTGAITPLSRMAGADGDSFEPALGASGDFVALSSFASRLGNVMGGPSGPNVFVEGPLDRTRSARPMLGLVDTSSCSTAGSCQPVLTGESVEKGAIFGGSVGVVGSPVRIVEVDDSELGYSVQSFDREGVDVAMSAEWICAIVDADASGNPGAVAACGPRSGNVLSDLSASGAALPAERIGLCGRRAIVLSPSGMLYEADLEAGLEATAVQVASDFALGTGLDLDGDEVADSCLVALRTFERDLGGDPASVGNRDLDVDDVGMYLLDTDSTVTDCRSSATDCPGQACRALNYQVGRESVLFIVDESDENFGFTPSEDVCSPGTDINLDGLCGLSVRRCAPGGTLTQGTSFGQAVNLFSEQRFQDDGENTVIDAGFCGTDPKNVRIGQLCDEDLDCLSQPGETCQLGVVALSALSEIDGDEIPDIYDNCPLIPNPNQADFDDDGVGDACDALTCGDGVLQEAEICDEGDRNGSPGSSCTAQCSCGVTFEVIRPIHASFWGATSTVIYGSVADDGTGCVNLSNSEVGGRAPRSIDPTSLRLSATEPSDACSSEGARPLHSFWGWWWHYWYHLTDRNHDGIADLWVHFWSPPIGADPSTDVVYLTGRFQDPDGPLGEACFVASAPVMVTGRDRDCHDPDHHHDWDR